MTPTAPQPQPTPQPTPQPQPQPRRQPKRSKGPRPKHVPVRMCVACRARDAKRGYVRLVRTAEGRVEVDPTGKKNGRGAYLCRRRACWQRALDGRAVEQALKIDRIDDETRAALRDYALSHFPPEDTPDEQREICTIPGACGP